MDIQKIDDILFFWFGDSFEDEFPPRAISDKWYSFQPTVDEAVKKYFSKEVKNALSGKYNNWADTPRGRLALILLLDQFTRHIYRNTSSAFAGDKKALELTREPLHQKMSSNLLVSQKMFFYAPLNHSENLSDQEIHKYIFNDIIQKLPNNIFSKLEYYLYWFDVHYEIIKRYGRFPWRNEILNRKSSPDELAYLLTAPNFGQK